MSSSLPGKAIARLYTAVKYVDLLSRLVCYKGTLSVFLDEVIIYYMKVDLVCLRSVSMPT